MKRRDRRRESSLSTPGETDVRIELPHTVKLVDNPHTDVEKKELQNCVTRAVDSLPVKHRTVVILHEFEGLTHVQVASILNCSEGTVRSRMHYARIKLRDLLKPYVDDIEHPLKKERDEKKR